MGKVKVLLLSIWYPLSISRYWENALKRNPNVDLKTCGVYTGSWIPWMGGMNVSEKYAKPPTYVLPFKPGTSVRIPYELVRAQMPDDWHPDLVLTVDAGTNWNHKPSEGIVASVFTDGHCVSGDTLLATGQGILYASEASIGSQEVCDKNGMSFCDGVVYKGNIPTREFTFENGMKLRCTDDHQVETFDNGFVEARELRVGDDLLLSRGSYFLEDGTDKDYSMGFVIGAFQGDGSFAGNNMVRWTISKKEKKTFGDALKTHLFNGFGIDTVTDLRHYSSENAKELQVRRWGFCRFLESLDLKSGKIPLFVRQRSRKFLGGYVAGLFAADGCSVDGRIQFATKHESLARELQIVLNYLGILSRIRSYIRGINSFKPGKRHWTLYVAAGNSHKFLYELTGEIPGKLINVNNRRHMTDDGPYQRMKIIDITGVVRNNPDSRVGEPVYDVINSHSHHFLANGISVHNCLNDWYQYSRSVSDYSFNMHPCYAMPNDKLLSYAFDPGVHYATSGEKDTDAVLIGMPYQQRVDWVKRLRDSGVSVIFENGPIFDEYRELNNRARIGLNWSSMADTNARVFELMAMKLCPVINRTPDLSGYGFIEGEHYLGFDNINEAVEKVLWAKNNPEWANAMALSAYNKVNSEDWTYDRLVKTVLKEVGL